MSILKVRDERDGMTQFFELQDSKKSDKALKFIQPDGSVKYLSLYTPKSASSSMFDGTSNIIINDGTRVALCSYCYDNCNHYYKNCNSCNKRCNGCDGCDFCLSCYGNCNSSCDGCHNSCVGCDSSCDSWDSCQDCETCQFCHDGCLIGDGGECDIFD